MKLSLILVLAGLALAFSEPKIPQRGVIHQIKRGVAGPNPYIFLTVPKGRSQTLVQGFEVIEDDNDNNNDDDDDDSNDMHKNVPVNNDDDEEENEENNDDDQQDDDDDDQENHDTLPKNVVEEEDDNDDDDEEEIHDVMNMNKSKQQIKNAKNTQMMISREHAGAIMVPDQVIEIEGQSVIDEKTGKPALLLPRAILDSIPDGSVVALMERSDEPSEEGRANRVMVRRRRKGARRNVKRRRNGANNKRRRVNRRGGNKRRRVNKRKNVRGGNRRGNRRRNNRRKNNRRRVVYQG